jgi:hypothetical protein
MIEIKTQPFKEMGGKGFVQCTARSKQPDVIQSMNNTYFINITGK